MSALTELSDSLASAVESAAASVVRVQARPRLSASGIVWSPDGVILTAHHVVEEDEGVTVGFADGSTAPAKLVGRDPTTDIAVLKTDKSGFVTRDWGEPNELKVGHMVLALGRPGNQVMATLGVISALGDSWRTPAGGRVEKYLQTDVVMYPGFSGGPLVSSSGQYLGLNTSGLLRGISMSLPVATLRQVVQILLTKGKVTRGYFGVGAQPVRLPEGLAKQLKQETGLLLVSVEPGGPADTGGILLGDVIISIGGQPVRHLDDLLSALGNDRIGTTVPVRIVRGGQVRDVNVVIGERD